MSSRVVLLICADPARQQVQRRALLREGVWVIPAASADEALGRELPPLDMVIVSSIADPASVSRLGRLGPVLRQPRDRPIRALLRWAQAA